MLAITQRRRQGYRRPIFRALDWLRSRNWDRRWRLAPNRDARLQHAHLWHRSPTSRICAA